MKIKLTRVMIVKTKDTQTFKVEDGLRIEYYGDDYEHIDSPIPGIVREIDGEFLIVWSDGEESTKIDGSDFCDGILKKCGF